MSPEEWLKTQATGAETSAPMSPEEWLKTQATVSASKPLSPEEGEATQSTASTTTPAPPATPSYQPTPSPTAFAEQSVDLMGMGDEGALQTQTTVQGATAERTYLMPEEVAKMPQKVSALRSYMRVRYPNMPAAETDLDLVKQYNELQSKTDMDIIEDAQWVMNATDAQKRIAYTAMTEVGDIMPVSLSNELLAGLKSPSSYVGGFSGIVARKAATRAGKTALQTMLRTGLATGATDATIGASLNVVEQKTRMGTSFKAVDEEGNEKVVSLQDDFNYAELALVTGINAVISGAGGASVAGVGGDPKKQMAAIMAKKKPEAEVKKAISDFLNQFQSREKEIYKEPLFTSPAEKQQARAASLDIMDEPKEVTNAVLNKETIKSIYDTAKQLFADNPDLIPADFKDRRITEVISDVLSNADTETIQQAAARAGVSQQAFLDAFKVTASDAGAILQAGSDMAKFFGKATQGMRDPELERIYERLYRAGYGQEYMGDVMFKGLRKFTDASVGAAVAGLSTTILNTAGLVGTLTVKTAVDVLDAGIRTTEKMVGAMRGKTPIKELSVKETTGQLVGDGFRVLGDILDSGLSEQIFTAATKYNPRIANMLLNASAEGDRGAMGKFVTTLNAANRAVEGFIRKPVFVASLRTRMKAVNLDLDDFIANDKAIPMGLMEQAMDDTLELTFSARFKKGKGGGVEGAIESGVASVVSAINANNGLKTIANVFMPFYRFGLSVAKYSYRLTPVSGASGALELSRASSLLSRAKELEKIGKTKAARDMRIEASGMNYQARQKILTSTVGTGLIAYAMGVREDNADLPATQLRDKTGEVHDVTTLAPLSNLLVMGDAALLLRDLGKGLWYATTLTEQERAAEAAQLRKQANSLARNSKGRQELINKAELLEGRFRNFDPVKFGEVIIGMGRMAGTQKTFIDSVKEVAEGGIQGEGWEEYLKKGGRFAGDFLSRFDNVLNPIYDVVNYMNEDLRQVDSKDAPTLGYGVFADELVNSLSAPMPVARERLRDKPSLFQAKTPQAANVFRYLTGEKPSAPTSAIENELLRVGIEPYKVYPRDTNRELNNKVIKLAQPNIRRYITDLIKDPEYKRMSMNEQSLALEGRIKSVLKEAKDLVEENLSEEKLTDRQFKAIPKKEREAAQDSFFRANRRSAKTMVDKQAIIDGDYSEASELKEYASGGLAVQTRKAFSI